MREVAEQSKVGHLQELGHGHWRPGRYSIEQCRQRLRSAATGPGAMPRAVWTCRSWASAQVNDLCSGRGLMKAEKGQSTKQLLPLDRWRNWVILTISEIQPLPVCAPSSTTETSWIVALFHLTKPGRISLTPEVDRVSSGLAQGQKLPKTNPEGCQRPPPAPRRSCGVAAVAVARPQSVVTTWKLGLLAFHSGSALAPKVHALCCADVTDQRRIPSETPW